jgi:putative membrane-bound dehydrogenase-like protein
MNILSLRQLSFFCFLFFTLVIVGCQNEQKQSGATAGSISGPVSPEDALSTFEVEPGFKIELLASEPLISDPVDMEIDEYGRLYVVEMHGYPLDKTGTGVIKLLSDSNGDGRMDRSTVFADGLVLPNSIMRWKKGLLITDAPNVLYFADTTGDGKADIRDTMLTGFALSNPQHNLNSPVLGIDNWIYLGHEGAVATQTYKEEFGDEGSEIFYPDRPGSPRLAKNASGRSVRFRPDEHLLETTSSITQFGHTFDEWGRHFLVTNWNHIFQEVMAAPYLKRNPELVVSSATQSLSDHNDAAEVFPVTKHPERQLLTDVGVITSACGLTRYLGGTFPAPFDDAIFVAEPVSNLVHVDHLASKGASFVASRLHAAKEFLASTDAWSRPVNMYVGPDGALYVVDYYRQIIEHPEWMGEEVVKSGQLYNGHDKGRIYRISPTGAKAADWTKGLLLGDASSEELVQHLANANNWWRLNAQRLLIDRKDSSTTGLLVKMTQNTSSAYGRLHALWTLQGLGRLIPDLIRQALKDPVAGVRENAVRLADLHLSTAPQLAGDLLELQNDKDAKVRFQLLCTIGSINTPEAMQVRNKLLFNDVSDQWMQVAALSGSSSQTASLLSVVLDSFRHDIPAYASLVQQLGTMAGRNGTPADVHQLIQKAATGQASGWQAPLLKGLAQGLKLKKAHALPHNDQELIVRTFFETASPGLQNASLDLLQVTGIANEATKKASLQRAAGIAKDDQQSAEKRVAAIRFLALGNPLPYAGMLKGLVQPRQPTSIQIASLHTLSVIPDTTAPAYLLQQWTNLTPEVQEEALNMFLTDTTRIAMLLNAIEANRVQPAAVGWHRSVRLMSQDNLRLREKARRLLTKTNAENEKVANEYRQVLSLNGNADKGKTVFLANCSRCHQVRGTMGVSFGPDLGTIHNWSADAIMANILAPNLSISSGFDLWEVKLKNGETIQGIISSETATSLTLKNAAGELNAINRADIQSLKALNLSAMPMGLEKQINQQQMADLLAFLRQNK